MEAQENPFLWIRAAWGRSRLDLLMPGGIGLMLAGFTLAALSLRSAHWLLLWGCVGAVGFAVLTGTVLLWRLKNAEQQGLVLELGMRDLYTLILPLVVSVGLYAFIAPSERHGLFFAFVALPHFFFVLYLVKRHARFVSASPEIVQPALWSSARELFAHAHARASTLSVGTLLHVSSLTATFARFKSSAFRRTPDFS